MTLYQTPREVSLFFVLSKTVGFMLLPTNLLIGLGIIGAILLLTRYARPGPADGGRADPDCGVRLLAAGFCAAVSARAAVSAVGCGARRAGRHSVLGGPIDADISAARRVPVVRGAPDRIVSAAMLGAPIRMRACSIPAEVPNLISNDAREADYFASVFEGLGIAESRLLMERRSRNTLENAEFSRDLANPKPGERWLVVTSAFHMPRSIGLFRKAGFAVEPYPVDWRVGGLSDLMSFSTNAVEGLARTDLAVREWMGLIAYRVTGKTDRLLPGP